MMRPFYRVWLWLDPVTREPKYVGYGSSRYELPWDHEWSKRGGSSELSQWLAKLEKQPPRDPTINEDVYFGDVAAKYAAQIRKGIKTPLLKNRSYQGTQTGGGAAKPVIDPNGFTFKSVRAAAHEYKVDVGTICAYLKHSIQTGWKYVDKDHTARRAAPSNACSLCLVQANGHKRNTELIAGPEWAKGKAICKRCAKVISQKHNAGELVPELLRVEAEGLLAQCVADHMHPRRLRRFREDDTPGFPRWLQTVADLIESSK